MHRAYLRLTTVLSDSEVRYADTLLVQHISSHSAVKNQMKLDSIYSAVQEEKCQQMDRPVLHATIPRVYRQLRNNNFCTHNHGPRMILIRSADAMHSTFGRRVDHAFPKFKSFQALTRRKAFQSTVDVIERLRTSFHVFTLNGHKLRLPRRTVCFIASYNTRSNIFSRLAQLPEYSNFGFWSI